MWFVFEWAVVGVSQVFVFVVVVVVWFAAAVAVAVASELALVLVFGLHLMVWIGFEVVLSVVVFGVGTVVNV